MLTLHPRLDCSLTADGFRADFAFAPLGGGSSRVEVALRLDDAPLATAGRWPILDDDILRLAQYLDDHVAALARDPDAESDIFVPLDLFFQLQALAGEVRADDDGEFTVRVMVNVRAAPRVYVGCEGVVAVADARRFAAQLRDIAARLARLTAPG